MSASKPHSVQDDLAIVRAALPRMEGYTLPVVGGVPDLSADPTPFWRLANPEVDAALKRIEEQLEAEREHSLIFERDSQRLSDGIRAVIEMGIDHPDALETLHVTLRGSNPASRQGS